MDQVISHIPLNASLLISGGACGVDTLAEQAARELCIPIQILRPDYRTHGRLAPLVRDDKIVQQADLVLAFWDGSSSGTAYTLRRCVDSHTPASFPLLCRPTGMSDLAGDFHLKCGLG